MEPDDFVWIPPRYNPSESPELAWCTQILSDEESPNNFARKVKWCPDGSIALAQCENGSFQFLDPPPKLMGPTTSLALHEEHPTVLRQRRFSQTSPILDFVWFPTATSKDPASFCFVASVRECPVKLIDGSDGRLRASYKIVDHRERQVAPHTLSFNATANKLYCGFENAIDVFDIHVPGQGTRLHTTPSKKSRDGLKGIISALSFSADVTSGVYAAGSLSPSAPSSSNIALFTEATGEAPVMFVGAENYTHGTGFGVQSGVTQLMFNPTQPYLLYASFRRHETLYNWDLRGNVSTPVCTYSRHVPAASNRISGRPGKDIVTTNQKLIFDIDIGGRLLAVGDQFGTMSVFDLHAGDAKSRTSSEDLQARLQGPVLQYEAHEDAIGSAAFHPLRPMLLSVSGSRHFHKHRPSSTCRSESSTTESGSEYGDSDNDESGDCKNNSVAKISRERPQPLTLDSTVKLWNWDPNIDNNRPESHGENVT
ncbi:hypothetical protein AcW1_002366 [Taiwanofungus camphoratus]|nr:hypothetical protein AcW1_002366 [Antrodia cinnamomea]